MVLDLSIVCFRAYSIDFPTNYDEVLISTDGVLCNGRLL
jgi:hypothetical protein